MNLTLIQKEKSTYTILYPSNGAACERKAAEETFGLFEKISGVKLHFFDDSVPEIPHKENILLPPIEDIQITAIPV